MKEEIVDSAKAIQEVAKATGQGIDLVKKIGTFFSRIMDEPIAATCGMLADTLKFKRWERQVKLIEKVEQIMKEKRIEGKFTPIEPKLALPIFHNASLENNELLHDLWAKLLVSAMDPSYQAKTRTAYIDIIKQLDPLDVKILKKMNVVYQKKISTSTFFKEKTPTYVCILKKDLLEDLTVSNEDYWTAVDNICRLGLACSYIEGDTIDTEEDSYDVVTSHGGYNALSLTALGLSFVKICTY